MINQRDILLVPFPFSDQSGKKVRPVLVLSNREYNNSSQDIIVCAITSNLKQNRYSIYIEQKNMESGILHQKSSIKVDTLLKINKNLAIKNIGTLNKATLQNAVKIHKLTKTAQ